MKVPTDTYTLVDSGGGAKLEQVGPYLLNRPAPTAIWSPRLGKKAWAQVDATYIRDSSGSGKWTYHRSLPTSWEISLAGLSFQIKLTPFGHLGLFPEQMNNWAWMGEKIETCKKTLNIMNLFAYTGGTTLTAARSGSKVCHLDASKGIVSWARQNAALSRLENCPIRWIIDDALKFLKRELRRKTRYDALVLDPPSFGRGAKGEVFKIERDLLPLLETARRILVPRPVFILLSCHSSGFTPAVLSNLLEMLMEGNPGYVEQEEMVIVDTNHRALPSGASARWISSESD